MANKITNEIIPLRDIIGFDAGYIQNSDRTLALKNILEPGLMQVRGLEIYDSIISADTHIGACWNNLTEAIRGLEYSIGTRKSVPEEYVEQWEKIIQFLEWNLFEYLDFPQLLEQALSYLKYGFCVFEKIKQYKENNIILQSLNYRGVSNFEFQQDGSLYFMSTQGQSKTIPKNELHNFFIPRHNSNDLRPFGYSIFGLSVFIFSWMKKQGLKDWSKLLGRLGNPPLFGKYPRGAQESEQDELMEQLKIIQNSSVATIPNDSEITLLESANVKSEFNQNFQEFCNKEISKLILGSTLTLDTDSNSGSRSQGVVHESSFLRRVISHAKELARYFTEQIIYPIILENFGEQPIYPEFYFNTEQPDDLETKTKIITEMVKVGLPIPQKPLYSILDLPSPEEGEPILEPEQPALPGLSEYIPNKSKSGIKNLRNVLSESNLVQCQERVEGTFCKNLAEPDHDKIRKDALVQIEILTSADASTGLTDKYFKQTVTSFQPLVSAYKESISKSKSYDAVSGKLESIYRPELLRTFIVRLTDASAFSYLYGRYTNYLQSRNQIELAAAEYPAKVLPFWQAVEFFGKKFPLADYPDLPGRLSQHLNAYYFRVAGVQNEILLKKLQEQIKKNIELQIPFSEFQASADQLFATFGVNTLSPWHLRTVQRTNVLSAYGAGRFDQGEALKNDLPILGYVTTGDERVRPEHAALDGYTASWDIFIQKGIYPPNDFNCRCTVIQLSKATAKVKGIKIDDTGILPEKNGIQGGAAEGWVGSPSTYFWEKNP